MPRHSVAIVLMLGMSLAPAAFAHTSGDAHAHGLGEGMLHPLTGLDHLAAMLGVGLWAAMRPGAGVWLIPAGFVTGMSIGLFSGIAAPVGAVEGGVILSLLALGGALFLAIRIPVWTAAAAAVTAGLFHGAAHAAEATDAAFVAFALGALAMTALLHAAGGLAGISLRKQMRLIAPAAGIVLAGLGLTLAAQGM